MPEKKEKRAKYLTIVSKSNFRQGIFPNSVEGWEDAELYKKKLEKRNNEKYYIR
jgi:hypothetical protein